VAQNAACRLAVELQQERSAAKMKELRLGDYVEIEVLIAQFPIGTDDV
jgi:hypothetical protein